MERLLEEAKASCEMYKAAGGDKPGMADAMFSALAVTLQASGFDNGTRLGCLFKLLLKCTTSWKRKEEVCAFAASVIAADYYLSVEKGRVAVPFLNKALGHYAGILGTSPLVIEDADRFLGQFRARNLKGKFMREFRAVKNIYMLSGAAHKLGLDLPLDELPADVIPTCWSIMDFPIFILLGVTGGLLIMYGLDDYRTARLAGTPIPITEALQAGEIFSIIIGIVLIIAEFAVMMRQYNPTYNRWMSKYYYWQFSR